MGSVARRGAWWLLAATISPATWGGGGTLAGLNFTIFGLFGGEAVRIYGAQ